MRKARCFISYCVDDVEPYYGKELVKHLSCMAGEAGYAIDFLFDKNLKIGSDLNCFMQELESVDSVIMLCSPKYKLRSEEDKYKESGVHKECEIMKERLEKIRTLDKESEDIDDINFRIFPLVIHLNTGGSVKESVPDFVQGLVSEEIRGIRFEYENQYVRINKSSLKEYENVFKECIVTTAVIHGQKSEYVNMDLGNKLRTLIYNRKAESSPILDKKQFVTTFFYDRISSQSAYILIGRKGSGKTTTKDYFYKQNKKVYKRKMELNINEIGIETIYNYLYHGPHDANSSIKEDIKEVFTFEKIIEFTWVAYIYTYSMYIISCEYKYNKMNLSEFQCKNFKMIYEKFSVILAKLNEDHERWSNKSKISAILYRYALSNTYAYFNACINNTRNDNEYLLADIEAQLDISKLLEYIFSKEIISSFYKGIEICSRRFLFTVDGFDTAAELFRKRALSTNLTEGQQMAQFESEWMLLLLETVLKIKADNENLLFKKMDFCITIPKDKFIEIQSLNRDKYKYENRICGTDWSGIELAIMVRKRLEALAGYPYSKKEKDELNCEQLIDKILEEYFSDIPREITITTNSGREYKMHLFHYILRYSFWRPRDILASLSKILKLYYGYRDSRTPITEKTIKTVIKLSSTIIVNTEFLKEYDSSWPDIATSIEVFRGKNILLTEDELENILSSKKFNLKFATEEQSIRQFKEIVKHLYEIGFLGIFVSKAYAEKYQMNTRQGFVFYEGMNCLNGFLNDDFTNCKFCINPVFCDKLNLVVDTEELIGINSWEVLHDLETAVRIKTLVEVMI